MKKCRSNGKECPFLEENRYPMCKEGFAVEWDELEPKSPNCTLTLIQWTFDDKPNSETFIPEEE